MNRTVVIATGVVLLAGAGVALATTFSTKAVDPTSATLAVKSSSQKELKACGSQAEALSVRRLEVNATAASSNAALKGAARLVLTGAIDKEANAGTLAGTLRIDTASGPDTLATFSGVYANGELHGLLTGRAGSVSGQLQPFGRLVADMSANFNASTGQLSSIKIGQTDGGGAAVVIQGGTCTAGSSLGSP